MVLIKRRIFFIFSVKSVQNLRTFWRTTQNLLILALLCSLYSKQTFKVHLGVEKHIERLKNYNYEGKYATKMLNPPLIYSN